MTDTINRGDRVQNVKNGEVRFGVLRRSGAAQHWIVPDEGGDDEFLKSSAFRAIEPRLVELADNLRAAWRRLRDLRELAQREVGADASADGLHAARRRLDELRELARFEASAVEAPARQDSRRAAGRGADA
jgi:hypothetical protein